MKAKIVTIFVITAFIFLLAVSAGCFGAESAKEYFPTKPGSEWTYKIEFGEVNPQFYYITAWYRGSELQARNHQVEVFKDTYQRIHPDGCYLKIGSREIVLPNQGTGYAAVLNIIKDDLNIFDNSNRVVWMVRIDKEFTIIRVVEYPGIYDSAWESPNVLSMQIIFFDPKIGNQGDEAYYASDDRLKFVGFDNNVPGYPGISSMHFLRTVTPDKGKSFTEDTWFAKGIGLVRLEQKVDGKISMIWKLQNFVSGN